MLTLAAFVDKYTGQGIDHDHAFGAQCVDLAQQYAEEVLGFPLFTGAAAIDIWRTYPRERYTQIGNAASNAPLPGDVLIWTGPDARVGTTQYGHIAVCITATPAEFTSFDQNWPEGSLCHAQQHTYQAVLGWLHPNLPAAGHPPRDAADATETLLRHARDLQAHGTPPAGVNDLVAAIARWPKFTA